MKAMIEKLVVFIMGNWACEWMSEWSNLGGNECVKKREWLILKKLNEKDNHKDR